MFQEVKNSAPHINNYSIQKKEMKNNYLVQTKDHLQIKEQK